jgi:hypothetical protein
MNLEDEVAEEFLEEEWVRDEKEVAARVCACGALVDDEGAVFLGRPICRACLPGFTREQLPSLVVGLMQGRKEQPRVIYRAVVAEPRPVQADGAEAEWPEPGRPSDPAPFWLPADPQTAGSGVGKSNWGQAF